MRIRGCQDDVWEQEQRMSQRSPPALLASDPSATEPLPPYYPPSHRDAPRPQPWQLRASQSEIPDPTFSTSTVMTSTSYSTPHSTASTYKKEYTTVEQGQLYTVERSQASTATSWATSVNNTHDVNGAQTTSASLSRTWSPPPVSIPHTSDLAREVMRAPKYGGHSKREQLGSLSESWGDTPGDPPRIGLFQPPPDLLDRAPSPFGMGYMAQWQRPMVDRPQWDSARSPSDRARPDHPDFAGE